MVRPLAKLATNIDCYNDNISHFPQDSPQRTLQEFDDSPPQGERASPSESSESRTEAENQQMTPKGATRGIQECTSVSTLSITLLQHDPQVTDEDVVYDWPVIKQRNTSSPGDDDIKLPGDVDPKTLFDDPGYTEGMIRAANGGNSDVSGSKLASQPRSQLPSTEHTPSSPSGLPLQDAHLETTDPNAPKIKSQSVQLSQVPGMNSIIDSLALLNYDDSELNQLDPLIATCLRSPNLSDTSTDDEIAISDV